MCGIVGAIAERNVVPILVEGLKRLEYRGYDSAGVCVYGSGELSRVRTVGKVSSLSEKLSTNPLKGQTGIAHTRWATHGKPTEHNAHPHVSAQSLAIVHNGIIENYESIKADLQNDGVVFESETDTEVIAHLLQKNWSSDVSKISIIQKTVAELKGAYGLLMMSKENPGRLYTVRSGSPIVIGLGIGENFISSDTLSLLPVTHRFIYLEEGDIAEVSRDKVNIYDANGQPVQRETHELSHTEDYASKGQYKHYMLKEIYEQSKAISNTIEESLHLNKGQYATRFGQQALEIFSKVKQVKIVACGTSYHAGLVAKYWIEGFAGIACDVEIASEMRYRKIVVPENCLFITLSQSGETADTLAALRAAKSLGYLSTLSICNVADSSLVRESDLVFLTRAGRELGVASTKAFVTQLAGMLLLTHALADAKSAENQIDIEEIKALPALVNEVLASAPKIDKLSEAFIDKHHALFLGRGVFYPIAMEGALKLKEISYIHAEAYPAGELKHGPLALVDESMPVVTVAPNDALLEKLQSNLQEVQARGGELFIFADEKSQSQMSLPGHYITIPSVPEVLAPIIYTLPLQLLSYYVAVLKGTDVDQPRNLAKSVTVE